MITQSDAGPQSRYLISLLPLYLAIFVGFVGYSLMITIFTPLVMNETSLVSATSTGSKTILLGIFLSLYPAGQFIGAPRLGAWSDRYGRRRVLLVSLVLSMVCYVGIGFSLYANELWLLMVASFVCGLCESNIVVAQSAVTDLVPVKLRNRYFGYVYLASSSAYIAGPLAGGVLANNGLVGWFGNDTPFWAVLVLLVVNTVWVWRGFKETGNLRPHAEPGGIFAFLKAISNARLRRFYVVNGLIYLAIFGFFRSYPMYIESRFHLGIESLSWLIAWVSVPIVLANLWITGMVSARFDVRNIAQWSAAAVGVSMMIIVLPDGVNWLWITLALTAMSLALCLPSSATMLSLAANEDEQGSVLGNNQSIQVGAEAVSGLAAGLLASIDLSLPLVVLGGVSIVAAVLISRSETAKTN